MNKTFTPSLLFFILFILFASTKSYSQTITIGTVDPGPYGQGSSIAVPIAVNDASGCVLPGNVYNLYLSDASGNFSPGTLIGSYTGFYATFVNGVIPTNATAGTGYRVMVKSTSPVASSAASAPFAIQAVAGVKPSMRADNLIGTDPEIFGTCAPNYDPTNPNISTSYGITNTSASGTTTTAGFYNETNHGLETGTGSITNPGDKYTFAPTGYFNYTVSARTVNGDGVVGTHDYQLINNVLRTNIGSTGNGFTCLSNGEGVLSFSIDISSTGGGVQVNYPGDTYLLNWGDGSSTTFTFCQLKALNGTVSHTFKLPSCQAAPSIGGANVFYVTARSQSPYCASTGNAPGVPGKVLIVPVTDFTHPVTACTGQALKLNNTSQPGPDPSNITTATCDNNPATLYDWTVGTDLYSGYTLNQPLIIPANKYHGSVVVSLHQRNSSCGGADKSYTICFENPAQPSFTITPTTVCASATTPVIPVNTSVTDATCSVAQYSWTVTGPAAVGYANGTSASSQTPQFLFATAGTYQVAMSIISGGCGTIPATPVTITVDALPTAAMSPAVTICRTNQTLTFDPNQTLTKTTLTGTTLQTPTTYQWSVSGGAFTFADGTNANSQYPHINFTQDVAYTISVLHTNSCGTAPASQVVTFQEPPTVVAGTYPPICYNSSVTLAGSVTGINTGYQWAGGAGTFSPDRNTLTATYTPTPAEVTAGSVVLTLQATSGLLTCAQITNPTTITITPADKITSAATKSICSGTAVAYTITANHSPSTFRWSAVATVGTPTGMSASSGTTNVISDVLTNTSNTDEVVRYTIIATYKGCDGPPAFLDVTVHPLPVIVAPSTPTICNNQPANIQFVSSIATGTTYTWTSATVAGISGNNPQATPTAATNGIQDVLFNSTSTPQTVVYKVTPYNNGCAGAMVPYSVIVGPNITPYAGPPIQLCGATSTPLSATAPIIGSGYWTQIQGPTDAHINDPTDPKTTVINLTPGKTYTFQWAVTVGSCPALTSPVTVEDDLPTVAGTADTHDPKVVCYNTGSGTIFLSPDVVGNVLYWESSTNGGPYTKITPVNTNPTMTFGPLTSTTSYRAEIQSGAMCDILPSQPVTITVLSPPVTANAGLPQSICGNGTTTDIYHLQGNNAAPGYGRWTIPAGSNTANFDDPTDPQTTVRGLVAGKIYNFTWTTYGYTPDMNSPSPCQTSSNTVTITDDLPAAGGQTSTLTPIVCSGITGGNIILQNQTGNVSYWESSTDGINFNRIADPNTSTLYQFPPLTAGPIWYRAEVQNGLACPLVPSDATKITVVQPPVTADAGPDMPVCITPTIDFYQLQGNNPAPGYGLWTIPVGSPTANFDNPSDPNTTVRGLVANTTYLFTWTTYGYTPDGSLSPCGTSFKTVKITADKEAKGGSASTLSPIVCSDGNTGNITLGGQEGNVLYWESSTDGVIFNRVPEINTSTSYTFNNITGTAWWYRAEVQNGASCPMVPSDPVKVIVVDPPVAAYAGPNVPLCNATSYQLQANDPSPGTGKWSTPPGFPTASFSNINDPHATVTLTPGTTYNLTWTTYGYAPAGFTSPCNSNPSTVIITDNLGVTAGTLTASPSIVCKGGAGGNITLSSQQGTIIGWASSTDNGTTWVPIANTGSGYAFPSLTQSTMYRVYLSNGNCNTTSDVLVTAVDPPVVANAGTSGPICNATTYQLQANDPGAGTGIWTIPPGSPNADFDDKHDPHTTVRNLTPGTIYNFTWTIYGATPDGSPSPCDPSPSTVTINDIKSPVGTTSSGAIVCAGINGALLTVTGQFDTNLGWEYSEDGGTTWTPTGNTTNSQPYSGLTKTRQFRVHLRNDAGCDAYSSITTITVGQPAVPAVAGTSQPVCNVTQYPLQGSDPGTGTGLWTVAAGSDPAFIQNPTSPNAMATGLVAGKTYKFTWTTYGSNPDGSVSVCNPSPNTITIIDDKPPVAGDITAPVTICKGNPGGVQLSNYSGTVRWKTSIDNGTTWVDAGGGDSKFYPSITQTTQYMAIVSNGSCGDASPLTTTIFVAEPAVIADAGPQAPVCNQTTYNLQGNDPGRGTGLWTLADGSDPATIHNATSPNATVDGMTAGHTYKFTWTITGYSPMGPNPCPANSKTITIVDDNAPVAGDISPSVTVCRGKSDFVTLTNYSGSIKWMQSINNGATWTATGYTTDKQPYIGITSSIQYMAIVSNGSCGDAQSAVTTISVAEPAVIANAGTSGSVCNKTTLDLHGNDPGTGTGLWTVAAGSASANIQNPTSPNATAIGLTAGNTYMFTWTITGYSPTSDHPCDPSPNTITIVDDLPAVAGDITPSKAICSGSSGTLELTNSFGSIKWLKSVDNGTTWTAAGSTSANQDYIGITQPTLYKAIVSNGSCSAESSISTITIAPPAIASYPGPDEEVCGESTHTLQATLPAGSTGKWTILSGAGAHFTDDTNPTTGVTGLVAGTTYKFIWTVSGTSPCDPIPGTVTIINDIPATGGITTAVPATVCSGSSSQVTLSQNQNGIILRWESSTDGTWQPLNITGQVQQFSNLLLTTQYRAILKGQGVCGEVPSAPVTVTVNPPTVIANAGGDDEVCSVTSYPLHGNSPGAGTGKWTLTGGPAGPRFDNDADPRTTVRNLTAGNTYQFTWTITGQAPCGQNSNSANITIDLQPVGGTTAGATTVCASDKDSKTITLKDWVGNITWQSSPDGISNWTNIQDAPAAPGYSYSGLTKTTYFRAMLTEPGKCSTDYSTVTEIMVNPATVIADAGQNFNICNQTFAKLNGNNPSPSTGVWTQTAGPVVVIKDATSYQAVATGLAKGNVYTFKWTITGLAPCANTEASVTIGAYEDVIPSFTKTAEHSCGPVNVTFTNTSTPSPVGTFEWNFGDGTPVITATNPPTHSFAPSTDGTEKTYTVTLTPTSNCGSKAPFTDYVKVSPVTAVASLLPGQTSYCGAFTLTAKNMSPGNNAQYDFYLRDAKGNLVQHLRYNDTEDAIFQTITPTVATYYTVSVTATDQCGNQASSTPVNISVAPSNIVSGVQIKGDLGTICLGSPITFQNISTGGDRFSITIFDANQKPLIVLPSGLGDLNYTPTAIGTYYVSMVAGNSGCGDAAPSQLIQFVVAPTPKPVFTYSTDNNYNVSFYNNTRDAGTIPAATLTYNWDFGDGSKNETAYLPNTHHFDASKSPFTVTLTATTPGTSCFNITQQTITLTFHGDLYFPNAFIPASSNRELNTYRVKGFGMKTWHMQIFNNFGQLIWETTKLDSNGSPVDGWDGTYRGQIVQQGVYIWQISATLLNGEEWKGMSSNGSTPTKTGPIHLIR